ncbi:MAG TPA: penicillin-binding transpeptidase domain-containing protein [Patescibacteria group bacterium]|nr:penicillin-binding transpeptidase domain-containing protein [Patescibacteria group bacterium]
MPTGNSSRAISALLAPACGLALFLAPALAGGRAPSAASPCAAAIAQASVCQAASREAIRLLATRDLSGAVLMQTVTDGALLAFAGSSSNVPHGAAPSEPITLSSPLLPLSTVKLALAASWWERREGGGPDAGTAPPDIEKMLVNGYDEPARHLALQLRISVGPEAVLSDLSRFGFPSCTASGSPPPPRPCVSLTSATPPDEWASALSVGESGILVSLQQLSQFLVAVGNDGVAPSPNGPERRIMGPATARQLQSAMLAAVDRGSGKGIRGRLGLQWEIGGKTGTGPASSHPCDGVFAGLVFDETGAARYSVICYLRHGGPGGGTPAEICAHLAKFVLGL